MGPEDTPFFRDTCRSASPEACHVPEAIETGIRVR
jgi:hypothetical protein